MAILHWKQGLLCDKAAAHTVQNDIKSVIIHASKRRSSKVNNPLPNKHCFFTCLKCKSVENTAGKGEIARDEQFLLFPQRFLPLFENLSPFS